MIKLNKSSLRNLVRDKTRFLNYAMEIERIFTGPSSYFYLKVIDMIRNNNYEKLFLDTTFVEYLYATLASWGMHRMDKHTRMTDFEEFRSSIIKNKDIFLDLSSKKIREVEIGEIEQKLLDVFRSLKVMSRKESPRLVAHSKIMHFLLPDLIPPIDKGHIIFFLYGSWKRNKKMVQIYTNN